jgi:hypothetical protein
MRTVTSRRSKAPSGITTADIFEELGGLGASMGNDPRPVHERCIGIAGEPGMGKSTIAQSEPCAIIIDMDGAGLVNPQSEAILLPGVGEKIEVEDPKRPDRIVTSLTFDYARAVVKRAVDIKRKNPEAPLTVWFDTISSLIESRIRKLEIDRGDSQKGTIMPFDTMNAMDVWPIIARNITDLIDELRQHRIGARVLFHVSQTKEKRFFTVGGRRTMETVTEKKIDVASSVFNRITSRLDEGFVVFSKSFTEAQYKEIPGGKKKKVGEEEVHRRGIKVDTDSDYESVSQFCKTKLPTLPYSIEWDDGEFDLWAGYIAPAYEKAISEFQESRNKE